MNIIYDDSNKSVRCWKDFIENPSGREESRYKEESPKRFERLVHKALASDLISMSKCASLLKRVAG